MVDQQSQARPIASSQVRPFAGWSVPITLAALTAGFSVLNPALLIVVPLAFMLVAMPIRRPLSIVIGVALLASTFTGSAGDALWWYGRGWSLVLSAWFLLALTLMPAATLMSRALAAIAGAVSSVALLFVANRRGWEQLDKAVGSQLRDSASAVVSFWSTRVQGKSWAEDLNSAIYRFTDFQANTYPAMIGIASLTGLAAAWWFWRRLSARDRTPFGRLRDFRFRDELVWVAVLGAALMALPLQAPATRAGLNLLVFMGALYVVRGVAVMVSLFGSPGVMGMLFGALLVLMLYPIVMATTLMVGLSDTWLDLRARRLMRQDNEKH
jgi:hypothetical protein